MKYDSAFRHLIVFVEQTLMTLQFSVVFFLKGQFLFNCWELPHRKQFRQFLKMCPSCPQALYLKSCLSFLLDGSSLPKDLTRWLGPGVGNRCRSLNPQSCCCLLSRLSSAHRPRELLRSLDWFRLFSRCLSSTDKWFTSLVTASTKTFVSSHLITATFGVCSYSSILVTASRCNARSKTVSIFISLWLICFLRSNLTWLWLIPSWNPLRTRWSLMSCDSVV